MKSNLPTAAQKTFSALAPYRKAAWQSIKKNPRTSIMLTGVIMILIGIGIHENTYSHLGEYVGAIGTFIFIVGLAYSENFWGLLQRRKK